MVALRRRARERRLGWRLVPPGLLRRWHARSAPRPTPSAGSTRSRSRGPSCPAPPIPPVRAGRWRRSRSTWSGEVTGWSCCSRRRSTTRDLDPGYIKGYLPGVRENGGQYTHAAVWSILAVAALGDGDKAAELFSLLNPINHASTPRRGLSLQGGAVRHGRRCLRRAAPCRPRRLDVVHRVRGLDVPGGHRGDPRVPAARRRPSCWIPASRRPGRATRSTSAIALPATRSSWRTPTASAAAWHRGSSTDVCSWTARPRSRLSTMAWPTASGSSLGDPKVPCRLGCRGAVGSPPG